jgi:hypothetical protein
VTNNIKDFLRKWLERLLGAEINTSKVATITCIDMEKKNTKSIW